ncbi:hypothetical protein chiPu_0027153, partial [Chiloscyllium punctatum]|nr:hypothetical protein [Chiloscyllium punctatum]
MGRGADVHAGVVEDEVVKVDELAFQPQAGAGVGEVSPRDKAVADRAFGQALVEARHGILRHCQRSDNLGPRQWMRDLVGRRQHSDNLNKNRRNRSYHGISFRHSDAFQRTPLTIDNLPLSIVLDTESQISDSQRPQPGKSRPPGLRSTRGRRRCQPPALFRTPSAAPGGRYLVRGTRRRRPALAKSRSFSRAAVASFGGSGPYQMLGGVWRPAARRSGPGQAKTLASLQTIQDRCASRPRRALVTAGISIAVAGSAGGLCVTGTTIATMRSPSRRVAATSAQGRFLIPSSAPRRCSSAHR